MKRISSILRLFAHEGKCVCVRVCMNHLLEAHITLRRVHPKPANTHPAARVSVFWTFSPRVETFCKADLAQRPLRKLPRLETADKFAPLSGS